MSTNDAGPDRAGTGLALLHSAMIDDLRHALRAMLRSPGFAIIAGLSLTLGIGANAAIYSVIDAVLLRPLPHVTGTDRLVAIVTDSVSYPLYRDIRDEAKSLAGTAGFSTRTVSIMTDDGAQIATATVVTGNFFDVLGVQPATGRMLRQSDDTAETDSAVAVLSHTQWQRRHGGSPDVVGRVVHVNGVPLRIVGVAPAGFRGASLTTLPDLWVPVHVWPALATGNRPRLENRGWGWINVVGRLRDGASVAEAEAEIDVLAAREARAPIPDTERLRLSPAAAAAAGGRDQSDLSRFLLLLSGIVGAALLMACANVANLMMVRVTNRRRELAVRQAIGAGRKEIARLLLAESLVLSTAAGVSALIVAAWAMDMFRAFTLPGGIPLEHLDLRFDTRFLATAAVLSLGAGLLVGVMPALQSSGENVLDALKDLATPGRGRVRARQALVAIQVAVCLLLLAGAALFVRSVRETIGGNVGFDVSHLATATIAPSLQRYTTARTHEVLMEVRRRMLAAPGVSGASWMANVPLSGERSRESIQIEGRERITGDSRFVRFNAVGASYFSTMGVPMRSGREFDETDRIGSPLVAIVNESMARRFWAGASPVGSRINLLNMMFEVVGVAADSTYESLGVSGVPHVFAAIAQAPTVGSASLVVRTAGRPEPAVPLMRDALTSVAPDLPVVQPGTFRERFAAILMPQRFAATLLSLFGAAALALAAVGIYGVTAFTVARRTREIGIRVALGAARGDVVRLVMTGTLAPIVLGAAAGLGSAVLLARAAAGFLPGVRPADPPAFAATAAALVVIAALATAVPMRRALAIDPSEALRNE